MRNDIVEVFLPSASNLKLDKTEIYLSDLLQTGPDLKTNIFIFSNFSSQISRAILRDEQLRHQSQARLLVAPVQVHRNHGAIMLPVSGSDLPHIRADLRPAFAAQAKTGSGHRNRAQASSLYLDCHGRWTGNKCVIGMGTNAKNFAFNFHRFSISFFIVNTNCSFVFANAPELIGSKFFLDFDHPQNCTNSKRLIVKFSTMIPYKIGL